MRLVLTRGSMNLSRRDGGLPPDSVIQDEDAILADSAEVDRAAITSAARMPWCKSRLRLARPFSVTTSLMRATAELASKQEGVRSHYISCRERG